MNRRSIKLLSAVVALGLLSCGGSATREISSEPPPPVVPGPAIEGRTVVETTIKSEALGVEKPLLVVLPAGYATSKKRYPVVIMLHGLGGYQESWVKLGIEAAADLASLEAIVVLPDGDDSFYVNWPGTVDYDACLAGKRPFGIEPSMQTYCVRSPRYADYLTKDLIAHIDASYSTIPTREARAIGGLSMGGYGALVTAFRHPELFSAVASHAGVASLRYTGPDPFSPGKAALFEDPAVILANKGFGAHFEQVFGSQIADWIARDPAALAGSLKPGALAIYIDAGTEDIFRLHNGAAHLAEVLTKANIDHEFHLIDGGKHDASFWTTRIDDSLRFFASRLPAPQP